jgi:L-threonylcarbamoyladenylate synthase
MPQGPVLSDPDIQRAVAILEAGGLVAFPTETVYGLGADASNAQAVRRIFSAKGRPADHPVIVHIRSAAALPEWARRVPPAARLLAERFWPGPLTLVLERAHGAIDEVTGGLDTIGLRAPSHPVAQALLRSFRGGIAAPSANRFGRISPTTAQHVRDELGDRTDLVLDGGACEVGIESTIVDLSGGDPVLLRPGRVGREDIEAFLGVSVSSATSGSPRAPGTLAAHYAPACPMLLVPAARLEAMAREQGARQSLGVLARGPRPAGLRVGRWLRAPDDPLGYAHDLYAVLRELDRAGCDLIIVESPPAAPGWAAVHDRLKRAAAGSGAPWEDET